MLHALLHRKVSKSVRRQEDVLTSAVFGALDLLPASLGLLPWLERSRNLDGQFLNLDEVGAATPALTFWPSYALEGSRVEPDVLLEWHTQRVLVEAKFGSGPSGVPSEIDESEMRGQLGRQWKAAKLAKPAAGETPLALIYLTAEWRMPRQVMESMATEAKRHLGNEDLRGALYWLSFRQLHALLPGTAECARDARLLTQLRRYLEMCGLSSFTGAVTPAYVVKPQWTYGISSTLAPTTSTGDDKR